MDDFLPEITQQLIENRIKEMQRFLQTQHQKILNDAKNSIKYMLKMKRKNIDDTLQVYQDLQQSFFMFCSAIQNLLNVFFPLLLDKEFLSLQCEKQIQDKIQILKDVVGRAVKNVQKSTGRNQKQLEKLERAKQFKNKAKNCKIPLQSTTIMQRWLLQHFNDPYPTNEQKQSMSTRSNLAMDQVNNWFINARERVIKKFLKKDPKEYQRQIHDKYDESNQ